MISLVAFLGNYGRGYERTRHNVGWQFAAALPFYDALRWRGQCRGDVAVLETRRLVQLLAESGIPTATSAIPKAAPRNVYFLKPLTYMNASGDAIGELTRFYKIPASDVLVVHDELELAFGTVSLKYGGGLGGHNGLRSTKAALGTADFWRLRFGLTKPTDRDIAGYVLSDFTAAEQTALIGIFAESARLFAHLLLSPAPQQLLTEWSKKTLV